MPTVAIVYFSAQGHTKQVAEAVAEGAHKVAGTTATLYAIVGADIAEGRYKNDVIMKSLEVADAIVFGTPTYMGGYAAQFKAFIDAASGAWMKQLWKDKVGAAFTHSSGLSGDKLNTLVSLIKTHALEVSAAEGVMAAISEMAQPGDADTLIELLSDRSLGPSRVYLVSNLMRSKKQEARFALMRHQIDPDLTKEITARLSRKRT